MKITYIYFAKWVISQWANNGKIYSAASVNYIFPQILAHFGVHLYFTYSHFHAQESQQDFWAEINVILLPVSVICTAFAYGIGVAPVLFALLGEILPLKIKGIATAIIMSLRYVLYIVHFLD